MNHLHQQKKYFNEEYSKLKGYYLSPWQKQYLNRINQYLLKKNSSRSIKLLDIAAGSGYVSIEMAKKGFSVYAIETSSVSIRNLRLYKKAFSLKNLNIKYSKAEKLPYSSNSIDYIVANAILEHIPEEGIAIKEWLRVLKPGGRMFITVPLKFKYLWPFFWPINYIHDKLIGHLRRYDIINLERKFRLKIVKVFYTGHFTKTLGYFINLILKNINFDKLLEKIDSKSENLRYGASNIIVIFEK